MPSIKHISVLVFLFLLPLFVFIAFTFFVDAGTISLFSTDSLASRLEQWSQVDINKLDLQLDSRNPLVFSAFTFLGYGPSHYGLTVFGSSVAGTHNAFIDVFLGFGLFGLFGYVLLIIPPFLFSLPKFSLPIHLIVLQILVFVCIAILSLRELTLAYLGVSSLLSLLLGFLSSVSMRRTFA